ncbi:MAG: Omp28 family outer membrane lipoprotein [Bacteroidia bacterium]
MKNKVLWILLFIAGSIYSCDKIDPPYTEPVVFNPGDTTISGDTVITRTRKVLLEDYTGHTCGNCPKAADAAEAVQQLHGEKVVVLGVHAGFFATPVPPAPIPAGAPAGSYSTDFRTVEGTTYDSPQFFGVSSAGNPNGMVNRKSFNGNKIVSYTNWASAVQTILNDSADVGSKIITSYDEATRNLNIKLRGKIYNSSLNQNLKVIILISESNIIAWQTDYGLTNTHVSNYNHKHVLKGSVNGTWGDHFANALTPAGTTIEKTYSTNLNNLWDENNCSVIAIIYNENSNEVVQADEVKIKN